MSHILGLKICSISSMLAFHLHVLRRMYKTSILKSYVKQKTFFTIRKRFLYWRYYTTFLVNIRNAVRHGEWYIDFSYSRVHIFFGHQLLSMLLEFLTCRCVALPNNSRLTEWRLCLFFKAVFAN